MKLIVIPSDSFISIDGIALVFPFSAGAGIHAIQWNGASGTIETTSGNQSTSTNLADVQPFIDVYNTEAARLAAIASTPPTLVTVKATKIKQIESSRDAAILLDVTALGTQWQADDRSQKLLGDALTLATAGLPLPSVWRDSFNNNLAITGIGQLLAIAGAMAVQTQSAYAKSWTLKAQVDAATTLAEVNAVTW
jgi:hypothetical protein